MRSNSCPKCQGSMAEGFVPTTIDTARAISSWYEGAPQKSFWAGVKLGKITKHAIQTYRCSRCGFLESYAKG